MFDKLGQALLDWWCRRYTKLTGRPCGSQAVEHKADMNAFIAQRNEDYARIRRVEADLNLMLRRKPPGGHIVS